MRFVGRRNSLVARIVGLTLVVLLVGSPIAHAALEEIPDKLGRSATNPWDDEDALVWWRDGWGNSLYPEITITNTPQDTGLPTLGFMYVVDRTPDTTIDPFDPLANPTANVTSKPDGSLIDHTFDLNSIFLRPPLGGWGYSSPAQKLPIEGPWFVHMAFYNEARCSTVTISAFIGIDLTPPEPVEGLMARTSPFETQTVTGWTDATRRFITWDRKAYDAMSGVGLYRVSVDGTETALVPAADHLPTQVTIENLPPGRSVVSVEAVDRATNRSKPVTFEALVDTDTPTVAVTRPASGAKVGLGTVFAADAKDLAGIESVSFQIDGTTVAVDRTAPYQIKPDLSGHASGAHTLRVVAKDMYGRSVSASRSFVLDKTAPSVTSVSDSPDPFYPKVRDGYRDYSLTRWRLSEPATVYLKIYKSNKRTLWRQIVMKRNAGWNSVKWDGKGVGGEIEGGTYYYRFYARDAAGNTSATGWQSTTIRTYILRRISPTSVRLIPM